MGFDGAILIGGMCLFMLLGVPIAVSMGMAAVLALLLEGEINLIVLPQKLFVGSDSFPLMAIIFFMVAGELMLQGGISKRLVSLAKKFLSELRGSLTLITFVTCAFFGALSGSALATTAAIGSVMYPEMLKDDAYEKDFALSVQAVGGTLGTMIPPSIPLVLYGALANTSVGDLFIYIIIPGILICFLYCITGYFVIVKRGMAKKHNVVKEENSSKAISESVWALLTPVIILGGIYSGIFSPTESAAVACGYAFFVGMFIYKELTLRTLFKAVLNATIASAAIMFLITCATFFGWVLTIQGFPQRITTLLTDFIHSKMMFLLFINIVFLIAGMFVDISTTLLLIIPLVLPIALKLDVNLTHLGIIAGINLSLGTITPPFGGCLFVASGLDKTVKLESIYREVMPFVIAGIVGIFIITYVPMLWL
ncbi:MAG TPA: C4-dicarboxylate ABC transporter permease [Synergistaceae bacterium]|jgi:C4-dicarboxylate transporter DctM subunit|nr:C4-dicarboxylate ABC transporter permease [Synergistaceae bacterium]